MDAARPAFLTTERLELHTWQAEDAEAFRPIASDPRVMRYISEGTPWPDERIREFVARQIRVQAERGFSLWWLAPRGESRLIGFCGLQPLPGWPEPEIEVGWWLAPDCWGRGLASEAARRAVDFGLQEVGLARIVAIAQPANRASLRVMEKLDMRFAGERRHRGIDCVLYALERATPG